MHVTGETRLARMAVSSSLNVMWPRFGMEIALLAKPSGHCLEGLLICLLWASRVLRRDASILIRRRTEQQMTAASKRRTDRATADLWRSAKCGGERRSQPPACRPLAWM